MDVCVFTDKFTFCDVINLGNFNGDYGFCDRLLCALTARKPCARLKDISGVMVLT